MNELDRTIQQYVDRSFGSMNKNDYEVRKINYWQSNELQT